MQKVRFYRASTANKKLRNCNNGRGHILLEIQKVGCERKNECKKIRHTQKHKKQYVSASSSSFIGGVPCKGYNSQLKIKKGEEVWFPPSVATPVTAVSGRWPPSVSETSERKQKKERNKNNERYDENRRTWDIRGDTKISGSKATKENAAKKRLLESRSTASLSKLTW